MTNIASECRSANIVRDHAMILPDEATPDPDGIFGKHRWIEGPSGAGPPQAGLAFDEKRNEEQRE
jgi:hypothetical protein